MKFPMCINEKLFVFVANVTTNDMKFSHELIISSLVSMSVVDRSSVLCYNIVYYLSVESICSEEVIIVIERLFGRVRSDFD